MSANDTPQVLNWGNDVIEKYGIEEKDLCALKTELKAELKTEIKAEIKAELKAELKTVFNGEIARLKDTVGDLCQSIIKLQREVNDLTMIKKPHSKGKQPKIMDVNSEEGGRVDSGDQQGVHTFNIHVPLKASNEVMKLLINKSKIGDIISCHFEKTKEGDTFKNTKVQLKINDTLDEYNHHFVNFMKKEIEFYKIFYNAKEGTTKFYKLYHI